MTKYLKNPPTIDAEKYDGSVASTNKIVELATDHGHYAYADESCGRQKDRYIEVFLYTFYSEKKNNKLVTVRVGDWFVINSNGKYKVLSDEDFQERYSKV